MNHEKIKVSNLENNDVFFVNRKLGWCNVIDLQGISFNSGKFCYGLEPVDKQKGEYHEVFLDPEKEVRIKEIPCYDAFKKRIKTGDQVNVQSAGIFDVYKKNGQLWFKPYGKEQRVCDYFSDDLIKM